MNSKESFLNALSGFGMFGFCLGMFAGRCGYPKDNPFQVTFHPERLDEPMHWKKPSRIFVCSMGDLFHEDVTDEQIDDIFATMALCPQHEFMVLTKRPERMKDYLVGMTADMRADEWTNAAFYTLGRETYSEFKNPLPNVWLGVTAENQEHADKRIPYLLETPAAKRFVSVEPMLGEIDLSCIPRPSTWTTPIDNISDGIHALSYMSGPHLDLVICGGESGPGARPMHPDWVRSLRDQCVDAGVPFFFKQWGGVKKKNAGRLLDGREWNGEIE